MSSLCFELQVVPGASGSTQHADQKASLSAQKATLVLHGQMMQALDQLYAADGGDAAVFFGISRALVLNWCAVHADRIAASPPAAIVSCAGWFEP